MPRKPRHFIPRFGLKSLIALVTMAALGSSLLPRYHQVKRQQQSIATLTAKASKTGSNTTIRYAHEFDADGNEIPNPKMPGPGWLRERIGDHWFLTPVELSSWDVDGDALSELTTLQRLDLGSYQSIDLRCLRKMQRLKSLKLKCYPKHADTLAELKSLESLEFYDCYLLSREERGDKMSLFESVGHLRKLKSLNIWINRHPPESDRDLSPLGNLTALRELKVYLHSDRAIHPHYDYEWIARLKNLEVAILNAPRSVEPLGGLTQLRELSIRIADAPLSTSALAKLTNLEALSINCELPTDLNWIVGMKKLKSLTLRGWRSDGQPFISDSDPLKGLHNLEELKVGEREQHSLDVELLKTTKLTLENMFYALGEMTPVLDRKKRILRFNDSRLRELHWMPTDFQFREIFLRGNQLTNLEALRQQTSVEICDLSENPVSDIGPLAAMSALQEINLNGCPVTNLDALEDSKQLRTVRLARTSIRELPRFASREIEHLDMSDTEVRDVTGLPQTASHVNLSNTHVSDFSALKDWPQIEVLKLSGSDVTDLNSFPLLPKLRELDLSRTKLSDATGIEKFPNLRELDLSDTEIENIQPLRSLTQLRELNLNDTDVSDLSPLENMKSLEKLYLSRTSVDDLAIFKNLNVWDLKVAETMVSSLEPIKDKTPENAYDTSGVLVLDLAGTKVEDLAALKKEHYLSVLNISATGIRDLSGLPDRCWVLTALDCPQLRINQGEFTGHYLRTVAIDCSGSDDLSGIANDNVDFLTLQNVKPTHRLDWLKECPLRQLTFVGPPIELDPDKRAIQLGRGIYTLKVPKGSRVSPKLKEQAPRLNVKYIE